MFYTDIHFIVPAGNNNKKDLVLGEIPEDETNDIVTVRSISFDRNK